MNIVRVVGFIAALGNLIFGIYNYNIAAAVGWGIVSLYLGLAIVNGLFRT